LTSFFLHFEVRSREDITLSPMKEEKKIVKLLVEKKWHTIRKYLIVVKSAYSEISTFSKTIFYFSSTISRKIFSRPRMRVTGNHGRKMGDCFFENILTSEYIDFNRLHNNKYLQNTIIIIMSIKQPIFANLYPS